MVRARRSPGVEARLALGPVCDNGLMQFLGSSASTSNDTTARGRFSMFRISGPGLLVFIIAFVVAVIFAANQNDVVGWVVAIIAGFWLALAAFVVFSIQKAAKKAGARLSGRRRKERDQSPAAQVAHAFDRRSRITEVVRALRTQSPGQSASTGCPRAVRTRPRRRTAPTAGAGARVRRPAD